MAYPTVSGPYGFKPVNLVGGQVFAGGTRQYPIQYSYATNLFNGDIVSLVRGTVVKNAATTDSTTNPMIGIFLGCSYTSPNTKQKIFSQYWPASTLAGDAMAYVCDDPDIIHKAVICSATTVLASVSWAHIGQNLGLIQNAGDANTGNSKVALLYSATLTTAAFGFRVVAPVLESAVVSTSVGSSSTTTITCTALTKALVVGTDVAYVAANGQIIQTGSFVSVAAAVGATSVTINATIAVPGSVTAIPSSSTIIFTQFPEVYVKPNFATHSYQAPTAI
jgi:hypothetical protein